MSRVPRYTSLTTKGVQASKSCIDTCFLDVYDYVKLTCLRFQGCLIKFWLLQHGQIIDLRFFFLIWICPSKWNLIQLEVNSTWKTSAGTAYCLINLLMVPYEVKHQQQHILKFQRGLFSNFLLEGENRRDIGGRRKKGLCPGKSKMILK